MDDATMVRYADTIVRSCLTIGAGELLAIHGEPQHRRLTVAIAEAGYRAGARYVDVTTFDPLVRRARVREAAHESWLREQPPWQASRMRSLIRERAGLVSINGPEDPRQLAGLDPRRAALERSHRIPAVETYLRAVYRGTARFCVVCWPTPGWAATAYPDVDPDEAARRVSGDLVRFCRISAEDGEGTAAWDAHIDVLVARAAALTRLELDRIELRSATTSLDVGLLAGSRFLAADEQLPDGTSFRPNLPTEEVFTSPDPRRVEGTFRCTRPLYLEGHFIEGIAGEIRGGRLERLEASDAADRDYLAAYLARDAGAGRLGELALVDRSSRIGQSGRVYGLTLLDENAASHIAFGSGFSLAAPRGINRSSVHLDVMIGSDDLDATGVRRNGERVPLIAGGAWQLG